MKAVAVILLCFGSLSMWSQEQFSVFFESNKYTLTPAEKASLQNWISQNATSKILTINGYTDEDGTVQYNDSLSMKRVQTVFNLIRDKVKIREDFKKISFGEGHIHSKIKAENRKVTLFYLAEKDLDKETKIIANQLKGSSINDNSMGSLPEKINFPDKIMVTNFDNTQSEILLNVEFMNRMNASKAGEKLKLDNLNFVLNTFAITKESRPKLFELLTVMQKNPRIKISIQGHLCCIADDKRGLSTQRAKTVKQFLEHYGVDSSRMTFKGFGGTVPIYPIPETTEEERAANRRVEIEIIEN